MKKKQQFAAIYSPDAVALMLGISTRTLANWRWKGIGPKFRKLGYAVFYTSTDVKEYQRTLRATRARSI